MSVERDLKDITKYMAPASDLAPLSRSSVFRLHREEKEQERGQVGAYSAAMLIRRGCVGEKTISEKVAVSVLSFLILVLQACLTKVSTSSAK
jgi:hypothetical protein